MEHAQAQERHAADLYVLGELSEQEADAFEDHFFDCAVCADDVRVGMNFLDGGRRMLREEGMAANANVVPIASRRRMNVWMPIAAAAMLVVVIGSPILLSRAKAPDAEIGALHFMHLSGDRGAEEDQTVIVKDGQSITLVLEIPPQPSYTSFEARVVDAKGTIVQSLTVSPEEAKNSLSMSLRGLGAGTYDLVVIGDGPAGQHAEVARDRFIVKRSGVNVLRRERWNSHTTQAHLALVA
jgi:hypothetical protein